MSNAQSLFQLGMDFEDASSTAQTEDTTHLTHLFTDEELRKDHFIVRDGVRCAGTHLILDVIEGERLDDLVYIEQTLRECVDACGATLLHIHLHHFEPNGGVSGVAVLAESHISIHTWPEYGFAALDVFMCGDAEPRRSIGILQQAFNARDVAVQELLRGQGA